MDTLDWLLSIEIPQKIPVSFLNYTLSSSFYFSLFSTDEPFLATHMHASDKPYDADYIELVGRQPSLDYHDKDVRDDESTTSNSSSDERHAMLDRRFSDSEVPNEGRISFSSVTLLESSGQDAHKGTSTAKTLAWQVRLTVA